MKTALDYLQPWQRDLFARSFEQFPDGKIKAKRLVLVTPRTNPDGTARLVLVTRRHVFRQQEPKRTIGERTMFEKYPDSARPVDVTVEVNPPADEKPAPTKPVETVEKTKTVETVEKVDEQKNA